MKLEEMQTVYTKYPNIALFAGPKLGSEVLYRLCNRASLMWLAGPIGDRGFRFHKVSHQGMVGYIAETALSLSPDPQSMGDFVCSLCHGSGHLPMPAGWEAYAGQALFLTCRACEGVGKVGPTFSAQAYASHGGTKA